jgi:Flp pilus assembly protein CpaB
VHRIRFLLARHPWAYWLVVLAVAVGAGSLVSAVVERSTASVRALGVMVRVPVAARAVDMGTILGDDDVAWRRLPTGALPDGPVSQSPVGGTALVPLVPGEPLLASKLAPDGVSGPAALVPPGARAVGVPVTDATPPVQRGDRVDLLAPSVLAADAVVLDVADSVVTVAVVAADAPKVAEALARGVVVLALASPWE